LPNIPYDAVWKSQAYTVAGGKGPGSTFNRLHFPKGLCVDNNQTIFVADSSNHRIMKYNRGATVGQTIADSWNDRVMKWDKGTTKGVVVAGGHGKGKDRNQLDYPTGVLVDRLGTVYVSDHWNNRVMRWRSGMSHGDIIVGGNIPGDYANQLNGPEGLVFDGDGNIWVADSNNHRIQKFDIQAI
ncbi:unnamed protein product, partial [Rotaria sp. Silwood1]